MKRIFTLLLLVFITIGSSAQEYKCFVPGTKQFFVNNYGYVKGMRIDSILPGNNNASLYYPFRTPRGLSSGTLTSSGSWLGRKVTANTDGTYLFETIWKDTAVIKTQAAVGDSWMFHNDSSNRHYMAELISVDMMNVAGQPDSVKKIVITAFENNLPNPADSFDGAEIILSKTYGFAQSIDLYMFPYHPYNNDTITKDYYFRRSISDPFENLPANHLQSGLPVTTAPGKYNTTFRQVDFVSPTVAKMAEGMEIGDVFMYTTCEDIASLCPTDTPFQSHLDTIKQKNVTASTVNFTLKGVEATFAGPGYYVLSPENAAMSYSDTTKVYNTATLMPEEIRQPNFMYYLPADMNFCRDGLMTLQLTTSVRTTLTVNANSKSYRIYKKGLGMVKSYTFTSPDVKDTTITYVNSGSIVCGSGFTPYALSVSGKNMQDAIKVYPNPANNTLYVELNEAKEATISVINITGQTVLARKTNTPTTQLDISSLGSGVYILSIKNGNGSVYARFVKTCE